MKRMLSIDFDYFIDTDFYTRTEEFPECGEEYESIIEPCWNDSYKDFPHLKEIGVIPEYYEVLDFIRKSGMKVNHTLSHAYAFQYAEGMDEVVNVDFHHDLYIGSGVHLDCSNWARIFLEDNPEANYLWVHREDSDTETIFGEIETPKTTDLNEVFKRDYDILFVCFSPGFTPPHLLKFYEKMYKGD